MLDDARDLQAATKRSLDEGNRALRKQIAALDAMRTGVSLPRPLVDSAAGGGSGKEKRESNHCA